jgi:hypothetical protein
MCLYNHNIVAQLALNVGGKKMMQFYVDVLSNVSLPFEKLSSWSPKSYKGSKLGKS